MKRCASSSSGFVRACVLLGLVLALVGCCPVATSDLRPLLPQGIEPTAEQADVERRETSWAFLDARGAEVAHDQEPAVVVIPFGDYMALLGVLDAWRAAAAAYRTAARFREPTKTE